MRFMLAGHAWHFPAYGDNSIRECLKTREVYNIVGIGALSQRGFVDGKLCWKTIILLYCGV